VTPSRSCGLSMAMVGPLIVLILLGLVVLGLGL
jgi:hypothetical protein